MWKREEAAKPVNPVPATNATVAGVGGSRSASRGGDRQNAHIGKSVVIKGDLSGSEDLTIDGQVQGQIELKQHILTVGPQGRIRAKIFAKIVVVLGEVVGNIKASDKVSIRDTGAVEGDIVAPKVAISEGARFRGKIDMQGSVRPKSQEKTDSEAKPQGTQLRPQAATAPAPVTAGRS